MFFLECILFRDLHPQQLFPVPNIHISLPLSDEKRLTLTSVSFNMSGLFKCEVNDYDDENLCGSRNSQMVIFFR